MQFVNWIFELFRNTVHALIPSTYYGLVLIVAIVIVILAVLAIFGNRGRRPNYVVGIVISILLVIVMASQVADRWSWMLGLLPTLLVGYQGFYLWLSAPTTVNSTTSLRERATKDAAANEHAHIEDAYTRMVTAIANEFAPRTLFIRYGLPAALLGIIGIVILNVLVKPGGSGGFLSLITLAPETVKIDPANTGKILLGLRLGGLGAYVYVLLELGRRTFRHDVTGASALWCLVTLILGPVLAGTVAMLWRMNAPDPQDMSWWPGGVVLFFAGYAPRRVIAAIEQAAIQLLKLGGAAGVAPTRQIPLSQIRGIGPSIEERLSEEGIEDVNALASAEPIRLFRNTSYDLRQILRWIDEAILIVTLPRSWQALEEEGITGAMALAWYVFETPPSLLSAPGAGTGAPDTADVTSQKESTPAPDPIAKLATTAKIDKDNLLATIRRLWEDRQVQDIWTLYHEFTEAGRKGTGDGNTQVQQLPANGQTDQNEKVL